MPFGVGEDVHISFISTVAAGPARDAQLAFLPSAAGGSSTDAVIVFRATGTVAGDIILAPGKISGESAFTVGGVKTVMGEF